MRLTATKTKTVNVPNDPDKGFIEIKKLSEEEAAQIDGKYFSLTDKGITLENYSLRDADFAKACLTGWGNLYDESGRPMKFNARNVDKASAFTILVDEEKMRFFEWVNRERETFSEELEEEEAQAEKN